MSFPFVSGKVFGVCCPRPDSKPSVTVPGSDNFVVDVEEGEGEGRREEEEYPIESLINSNCGQRFVGPQRIVNGQVTRKHELPFMVRLFFLRCSSARPAFRQVGQCCC